MTQPEWHLGQTSARYEGHGSGTISSGKGDYGGVSYGMYQFSTSPDGGSLKYYLRTSAYRDQFNGLAPKTPAFDAKWKALAKDDPGFAQDQHDMMKRSHYDPALAGLKVHGVDLSTRGPAVQDALWSTSVQFGPGNFNKGTGAQGIFEKGMQEKFGQSYELSKLSDKGIVEAVQEYKIKHNEQLFRSSPKLWHALAERARHEGSDLLKLADHQGKAPGKDGARREPPAPSSHHEVVRQSLMQGTHGTAVHTLQEDLSKLSYIDSKGHPLKADGDFGLDTRHAVEAFQRDHHLTVDGKVGHGTQTALQAALQTRASTGMDDKRNPDHALYQQALAGVQHAEAQRDIARGLHSERLAAALVVAARSEGITRIDRVVLNEHGDRAFVEQKGSIPGINDKIALVDTCKAIHTTIAHSSTALAQVDQQQHDLALITAQLPSLRTPEPPAPGLAR